jgi:Holliday junction resolvase-like predicted endonuclease
MESLVENYVEELVEQWLNFDGYFTWRDVPFWRPKRGEKKQGQWGDVDIIAVKDEEAILVECKEFLGVKGVKEISRRISQEFEEAEDVFVRRIVKNPIPIPSPDLSSKRKVKRLLVAASPENLSSYRQALTQSDIEVKHLKEILDDIIKNYLKTALKKGTYGKHKGLIRFLITLMRYEMLTIK